MFRILLPVAAFATAFAGFASAQTAELADRTPEIFQSTGLIGTWATNCKAPASHDNLYMVFSLMPNGKVKREFFDGPKLYNTYSIYDAKVEGDEITFTASDMNIPYVDWSIGPYNRDYEISFVKKDDAIRLWNSGGPRGMIVEGGQAIDTHVETAWQTKCR